jgi:hypothetical protein
MSSAVYEARYRFTPYAKVAAPLAALIMTAAVSVILVAVYQASRESDTTQQDLVLLAVTGIVFLLGGVFVVGLALTWVAAAVRRWTALRVDQHGVMLGRRPFPGSRPMMAPWPDIEAIVLFFYSGKSSGLCIGLRLTPTAPRPSPGPPAHTWQGRWYIRFMTAPDAPADVYLGVQGWDLEYERLVEAMDAFAPRHVELIDLV